MKTLLIILILILGGLFAGLILLFNYGAHRKEKEEERKLIEIDCENNKSP